MQEEKQDNLWIGDIGIYIRKMRNINNNFLSLYSLDAINDLNEIEETLINILLDLFIVIPCKTDYLKQEIILLEDEGVLDLKENLHFLLDDFKKIIFKNEKVLFDLKILRNKIEHEPHRLKINSVFTGSGDFSISYEYKEKCKENAKEVDLKGTGEEDLKVDTTEFKKIITDLNETFNKIQDEMEKYRNKKDSEFYYHPYFIKHLSIRMISYNSLYENSNLIDISNILNTIKYK